MAQISPARYVAFRTLLRVETQSAYAVELLNSDPATRLTPVDHALAQELVFGCLRRQGELDWLIHYYSKKDAAKLDPEVRIALRLGIYQIRFLMKIPARAAVDQSVELTRKNGKTSAAALVNAVLRKVRPSDEMDMPPTAQYSTPAWLLERWGHEVAARMLERPATFLRLPAGADAGDLQPGHYVKRAAIAQSRAGTQPYPIQDESSQVVPYLLDAQDSHWILDLCSAPGNKTDSIAEIAPAAHIVAADRSLARLARTSFDYAGHIREEYASDAAPMRVVLDGGEPLPFARKFDRILLDAPCSGTGTVRRNPEIKWRLREDDLASLAAKQSALLDQAVNALAAGGRIVYSTCSLEPEENDWVVEELLKRRADEVRLIPAASEKDRLKNDLTPEGLDLLGEKYFRVKPSDHGADGFFAAILSRI